MTGATRRRGWTVRLAVRLLDLVLYRRVTTRRSRERAAREVYRDDDRWRHGAA